MADPGKNLITVPTSPPIARASVTATAYGPSTTPGFGRPVWFGLLVIGLFGGFFGGWAATAQLQSAAIAAGVVSVATSNKTVQHLEGGIVRRIYVGEGQAVMAGEPIVQLDQTRARASLEFLDTRLLSARATKARLVSERDGSPGVVFPDELKIMQGRDPAKVMDILTGQERLFAARRGAIDGQVAVLKKRVPQLEEEIKGLRGQIRAQNRQLELIADELKDLKSLVKQGLARRPRLLALQRVAAEIEGMRSQGRARIARANQSIDEARLRVHELWAERINGVAEDLRATQAEIFDLVEKIRAAEDVLDRTTIAAPINGTVVDLTVHTAGGVIGPGEVLMSIVPKDERLVIQARVDPMDIDVVHPGLVAKIHFSAFSRRNTVPVEGTVLTVSADRLTDPRSGVGYYLARVGIAEDVSQALDGAVLQPGMQAEVMIVTGTRTPLDYLLKPLLRSFNRGLRED